MYRTLSPCEDGVPDRSQTCYYKARNLVCNSLHFRDEMGPGSGIEPEQEVYKTPALPLCYSGVDRSLNSEPGPATGPTGTSQSRHGSLRALDLPVYHIELWSKERSIFSVLFHSFPMALRINLSPHPFGPFSLFGPLGILIWMDSRYAATIVIDL